MPSWVFQTSRHRLSIPSLAPAGRDSSSRAYCRFRWLGSSPASTASPTGRKPTSFWSSRGEEPRRSGPSMQRVQGCVGGSAPLEEIPNPAGSLRCREEPRGSLLRSEPRRWAREIFAARRLPGRRGVPAGMLCAAHAPARRGSVAPERFADETGGRAVQSVQAPTGPVSLPCLRNLLPPLEAVATSGMALFFG